jgi:hypothetical protein
MGSVIDAESEHARAVSMRVSSSPLDHMTADMKRKLDDTAAKKERCATRQRKYYAARLARENITLRDSPENILRCATRQRTYYAARLAREHITLHCVECSGAA